MKAQADMKMVEVSTEGVPQFYILIVLYRLLANHTCVGLLDENDPWAFPFLIFSLLQTYTTIISSTITSINVRKKRQLITKSKIVLAMSITCQLVAKLWIMVNISLLAAVPDQGGNPVLSLASATLLLVLPVLVGWACNLLLNTLLDTDFFLLSNKDMLIHLLSTTWFTVPVRRMEVRDQNHKAKEIFFSLLLAGLILLATSVALLVKIITVTSYFDLTLLVLFMALIIVIAFACNGVMGSRQVFRLCGLQCGLLLLLLIVLAGMLAIILMVHKDDGMLMFGLLEIVIPSMFLHLAGCGLLRLFEKMVHPWRQLGEEREKMEFWGKLQGSRRGITTEPTVWEQVGMF